MTTPSPEQLELAARIIREGLVWEWDGFDDLNKRETKNHGLMVSLLPWGYTIRIAPNQPPKKEEHQTIFFSVGAIQDSINYHSTTEVVCLARCALDSALKKLLVDYDGGSADFELTIKVLEQAPANA